MPFLTPTLKGEKAKKAKIAKTVFRRKPRWHRSHKLLRVKVYAEGPVGITMWHGYAKSWIRVKVSLPLHFSPYTFTPLHFYTFSTFFLSFFFFLGALMCPLALPVVFLFVGADDVLHEAVAHDVVYRKTCHANPVNG